MGIRKIRRPVKLFRVITSKWLPLALLIIGVIFSLGLKHSRALDPPISMLLDTCSELDCIFDCLGSHSTQADPVTPAQLNALKEQFASFPTFSLRQHRNLLVHYELLRLFRSGNRKVRMSEKGMPPIQTVEDDINLLSDSVYLRSLPSPALTDAVNFGIISPHHAQSKQIGAIVRLLLVSEELESGVGFGVASDSVSIDRETLANVIEEINRDYPNYVYGHLAGVVGSLEPFYERSLMRLPICADKTGETAKAILLEAEDKLIKTMMLIESKTKVCNLSESMDDSGMVEYPATKSVCIKDRQPLGLWLETLSQREDYYSEELVSVITNYLDVLSWMYVVEAEMPLRFEAADDLEVLRRAVPKFAMKIIERSEFSQSLQSNAPKIDGRPIRLAVAFAEWCFNCRPEGISGGKTLGNNWLDYVAIAIDWLLVNEADYYRINKWREYFLDSSPHLAGNISSDRLDAIFEKSFRQFSHRKKSGG